MRSVVVFAVASLVLLAAGVWLFGLAYEAPDERHAVLVSACVAFVVQVISFIALRFGGRENMIAMWGVGMLLRMATLAAFAFVVVGALGLPSGAALISLVAFFLVSSLLEPLLINT
ncbi:MAG TPA: hypothetical protein VKZ41_05075 [Gemmatimonadales bacterium]|nr:hypothetical protein [Gemmatimonadales bacterium]